VVNDPEARRECVIDERCHAIVTSPLPINPLLYRHVLFGTNGTMTTGVVDTTTLLKTDAACAPPSAPPILITSKIGFVTLVQATVETFNRVGYRNRMATRLSLPVAQIEVSVSAGSVIVVTTVSVEAGATGVVDSIVELQADTAATTAMFGAPAAIDVASIETTTLEPPAPPPEAPPDAPPDAPAGSSSSDVGVPWLWIGLAISASALMGIVVAITIWSSPKPQYTTPPKQTSDSDVKPPPPAATTKTTRQLSYGRRTGLSAQQQLLRPEESTPNTYWWLSRQ
jgi:hypothetical protein